jgi:hypothetical protein
MGSLFTVATALLPLIIGNFAEVAKPDVCKNNNPSTTNINASNTFFI